MMHQQLSFPFWDSVNVDFCHLDTLDSTEVGSALKILRTHNLAAIESSGARVHNVAHLYVESEMREPIRHAVFALLPKFFSLVSLQLDRSVDHVEAGFLVDAFAHLKHLTQLKIWVALWDTNVAQRLFDSFATKLRLKALFFGIAYGGFAPFATSLCDAIKRMPDNCLQSLELQCRGDEFAALVCENLVATNLRILRICDDCMIPALLKPLCSTIDRMPFLHDLRLEFEDTASVKAFTDFMLLSFRPWTCFRSYIKRCDEAEFVRLLQAFKTQTRLRKLSFDSSKFDAKGAFESSGILDEGWLCEVKCSYMTELPGRITNAALRNGLRHFRCRKVCIALIHSRAKKRVFSWIPLEIVLFMTRYLWDTRNQSDWDAKSIK